MAACVQTTTVFSDRDDGPRRAFRSDTKGRTTTAFDLGRLYGGGELRGCWITGTNPSKVQKGRIRLSLESVSMFVTSNSFGTNGRLGRVRIS